MRRRPRHCSNDVETTPPADHASALPLRLRRLQPIAQRHQFIHLGNDAVLFGEGWEGNLEYKVSIIVRLGHRIIETPWPDSLISCRFVKQELEPMND